MNLRNLIFCLAIFLLPCKMFSQTVPEDGIDSVMYVYLPYDKINIVGELPELDSIVTQKWKIVEGSPVLVQQDSLAQISGLVEGLTIARYIATDKNGLEDSTDVKIITKYIEESPALKTDPGRGTIITTSLGSTIATADGERLRGSALPAYNLRDASVPTENKFFNQNYYNITRNDPFI